MPRILLLCFVHGFKGSDNTFRSFPDDLKRSVAGVLPDHRVETAIYPQYETRGELAEASQRFLEWLKERVTALRKAHLDKPWPPNDRQVGVVLVAHSMGGFVAADALFLALDERRASIDVDDDVDVDTARHPLFPPIQGLLTFDTPYNGLARSMFVYGAFSNYSKVQTVFNVMTALSAGPVALGKLAMAKGARPGENSGGGTSTSTSTSSNLSRNFGWKAWQLVAVRTGTVGAIAAGGVAAYTHRKTIMDGVKKVRGLDRQTLREGYQSSVEAIGQGLAYVNRRSVGASFAWLSAHFTFVGALVKQAELNRRLQRLAALEGIGIHDMYVSLGANGYWSGGYFVPERTFCAVPEGGPEGGQAGSEAAEKAGMSDETEKTAGEKAEKAEASGTSASGEASNETKTDDAATKEQAESKKAAETKAKEAALFERWTMNDCDDEVQAHISLFKPAKNAAYDEMTRRSAALVAGWFESDEPIVDDAKAFAAMAAEAQATTDEASIRATEDGVDIGDSQLAVDSGDDVPGLPDESPIDIAATASLMADDESTADRGASVNDGRGNSAESAIVIDDDDAAVADIMTSPLASSDSTATAAVPAEEKANYLRHLLSVAQNAGTGLKRVGDWSSQLPAKMPRIDGLSRTMPAMPSMPSLPKSASNLIPSSTRIPGASMFSRKGESPVLPAEVEDVDKEAVLGETTSAKTASERAVEDAGAACRIWTSAAST